MIEAVLELVSGGLLLVTGLWVYYRRYAAMPKPGDTGRYSWHERAERRERTRDPHGYEGRFALAACGLGLILLVDGLRVLLQ